MSAVDRRAFLLGNRRGSLDRTANAAGHYQPTKVAAPGSSPKSVVVPTHEFAGNLDERLDFPEDWELNGMHMKGYGAPPMSAPEIAAAIRRPIGAKPLRELAEGKSKVVITFDDLTRATPTFLIVPHILNELQAAGVRDESILFLGSFATHRPMTAEEVAKKLGRDVAARYAWVNHACFYGCKEIGTTSFKTNVMVNQTFLDADLKITLSGIKVHYDAGYGGGAKAVLPGLAHIDTIEHNHNVLLRETNTAGPVRVFKNEMRLDLIEAARMAQVDFSVQTMYDQKQRVTHVFAGDIVDAHHAAVRVAAKTDCTPTFKDADIVVTNAYPQCAQAQHAQRWIGLSVKEGGTGVLIIQHPLTTDPIHFLNNRTAARTGMSYYQATAARILGTGPARRGGRGPVSPKHTLIVYSQYMNRTLMNNYVGGTIFASSWEEVIRHLREKHKGSAVRVAVYPYGGMQHQELELDG
jgi:nickel-dependent lactate racemase